jgi:hypothetical protein
LVVMSGRAEHSKYLQVDVCRRKDYGILGKTSMTRRWRICRGNM